MQRLNRLHKAKTPCICAVHAHVKIDKSGFVPGYEILKWIPEINWRSNQKKTQLKNNKMRMTSRVLERPISRKDAVCWLLHCPKDATFKGVLQPHERFNLYNANLKMKLCIHCYGATKQQVTQAAYISVRFDGAIVASPLGT